MIEGINCDTINEKENLQTDVYQKKDKNIFAFHQRKKYIKGLDLKMP